MQAKLEWRGDMTFIAQANSGFPVTLDTDKSFGGNNSAPSPMELILMGLAGCMSMDVMSILQKKRQNVIRFEARAEAKRAGEHPKVFTDVVLHFTVTGEKVEEQAVARAIELAVTKYCPAYAMLEKAFSIETKYEIHETS